MKNLQRPSLCALAEILEGEREVRWDALLAPQQLSMEAGAVLIESPELGRRRVEPTAWAETQLLTRLGIPPTYHRRCPVELQDRQFAYWLSRLADEEGRGRGAAKRWSAGEPRFLVRGEQERVRAFLTPAYTVLDDLDIVRAAGSLMRLGLVVESIRRTERSLHIRLIDPLPKADYRLGDPLYAGVHLANSEVGMRCLTVDALVHRLLCTNGLVATTNGPVLRRRHQGPPIADLPGELERAARRAVELSAQSALRLSASRERRIKNPFAAVRRLERDWKLGEGDAERMIQEIQEGPDPMSLFSLVNAATSLARGKDADERLRIETLAMRLLN